MEEPTATSRNAEKDEEGTIRINSALIAVYHKEGIDPIVQKLYELGVDIYSTGGTHDHIRSLKYPVRSIEGLTSFPSIFGGRVKTLHPKVFGGILARRGVEEDSEQLEEYHIPEIDLVIVDLYPFEETLAQGGSEEEVIEKIDIGGMSLIRAAAKNFENVLVVPSRKEYPALLELLSERKGDCSRADRKAFAKRAFSISSHYDTQVANFFDPDGEEFRKSYGPKHELRYGENPHQKGAFYGELEEAFEQLNGKTLSYNNLLDLDAAAGLIRDFKEDPPTFSVIKHNNPCGLATRESVSEAWEAAKAGDPVSAFGGILISNAKVDAATAESISDLFFEVLIAPDFDDSALETLRAKKKRIVLKQKKDPFQQERFRSALNGVLSQDNNDRTESEDELRTVTQKGPSEEEVKDLLFASRIAKHTRSNTIVLAKGQQLVGSGTGQTSRVDALKHAIQKAGAFGFDLNGAVMASDAFFPFPDCVDIANEAGISSAIQPGGSVRDQESIDHCDRFGMSMVLTGIRHFKH
jgi:phosphoribosylaminoimidazolecarboxamide formyltransferase/IMP cyclohydrolase